LKSYAAPEFWHAYTSLPHWVRDLADANLALLKNNPRHPSLQLKRVGKYWSARVGIRYRALGVQAEDGILWIWIGHHSDYDKLIR
jgi:hypothetical protein